MKKLLATGTLVCVLFTSAFAGPGETGGDEPPPCPPGEVCDSGGGGAAVASDDSLDWIIVDGVLVIFSILR